MIFQRYQDFLWLTVFTLGFLFTAKSPVMAQDWAKPSIKFLQRLDLRDLGYPQVNEIPVNSSAITSLITAADGLVYGATCGEEAYLFLFDPAKNKVRHLGRIAGQEAVHHSLVEGAGGVLYLGTGKNPFIEIPLSKGGIGREYTDVTLWNDISSYYKDYPGGRLYLYDPAKSNKKVKLPDMECELEDLGLPVANNSVYALTISPAKDKIYGLSYPDGHFFIYDTESRQFRDLGEIDGKKVYHGPERYWRSLPRALVCDSTGRVYTTGTGGNIVYYDPARDEIVATKMRIPMDHFPAQFIGSYAVVECFTTAADGTIYGGSSDGYLFCFKPGGTELLNLGKPRSSRRIRAITMGNDGKVYLMAGQRASTKPCQLYRYDPERGDYSNLGLLIADRSPYYYWRGYQFDCMSTGPDGTIYFGESERRSHLFLYVP